jgi:hypothetical protein
MGFCNFAKRHRLWQRIANFCFCDILLQNYVNCNRSHENCRNNHETVLFLQIFRENIFAETSQKMLANKNFRENMQNFNVLQIFFVSKMSLFYMLLVSIFAFFVLNWRRSQHFPIFAKVFVSTKMRKWTVAKFHDNAKKTQKFSFLPYRRYVYLSLQYLDSV